MNMVQTLPEVIFTALYLVTIWIFNILMYRALPKMEESKRQYVRWLAYANIFLASGDIGIFISVLTGYLTGSDLGIFNVGGVDIPFGLIGVIATSITMSCYYLFIQFYDRDKFRNGVMNSIDWFVIVLFITRLLTFLNPYNVWFSSLMPPDTPNYSAWIRNIPLFIFGLVAVTGVLIKSRKQMQITEGVEQQTHKGITWAMIALYLSFICYFFAIFFGVWVQGIVLGMLYIVKTIAYVIAAIFMWKYEYK